MPSSPLAAVATLLGAALLGSAAAGSSCPGRSEACPAAAGSAMLQTGLNKGPLAIEGRVATLDAELASLDNRVTIMMSTVGLQTAALMAKSEGRYDRYKALLKNKYDEQAIVDVVHDLEVKADNVKAHLTELEKAVSGSNLALIQKLEVKDISVTNRVMSLEEVVSSLKDRARFMEEKITGMASKAL
jgi:hypothetical protein